MSKRKKKGTVAPDKSNQKLVNSEVRDDVFERVLTQSTFDTLASKWKLETGGQSSPSKVFSHDCYLKVISYGRQAIPFILRDLQKEAAPWFMALRIITGENEINRQNSGDFRKIANAWIQWGSQVSPVAAVALRRD